MYIGKDGLTGLLTGLIIDCIKLFKTDQIIFEIKILGDNDYILAIAAQQNSDHFWKNFSLDDNDSNLFFHKVLRVIASNFEIRNIDETKSEICFSFDKKVIADSSVDYLKLSQKVIQIALLNRGCEIITLDRRQKYTNQNYYHFPQGIFYLFGRATTEVLGKPELKFTIDTKINNNAYQIGLAYRTDWFPTPNVVSFANDVHTIYGGSLVDGILDGLVSACKAYRRESDISIFKINRKKLANGLILFCAVRGQEFKFGGSWEETLEDETVKKQAKKLVAKFALVFFETHKNIADKFFVRFDMTQLGRMY